jgi:glycosyltransferase involved in cell wall biosynthesis
MPPRAAARHLKLLHVLPTLDPASGGPIEVVRQRSIELRNQGHSVDVVTLDDPSEPYLADFPTTVHALGPSAGGYKYNRRLAGWMHTHAHEFSAVVLDGIWQYSSFGSWRALRELEVPYFVFPHGMLDPWFKTQYPLKHLKKFAYWQVAEHRVLRDARAVLFTTEDERIRSRQSFWPYHVNEKIVAIGTRSPPPDSAALRQAFLQAHPELAGRRFLLFLGRIHEKKGCDLLIEAFARVHSADPDLYLVIAGPDATDWVPRLQALAARLGVDRKIVWPGLLRGDVKWGAFYCCEAFVLPSHQENFGVAVAEALGCGRPVLISDKVNIWREIEADGAGLVAADTADSTADALMRWIALAPGPRAVMGRQARETFERRFTIEVTASAFVAHITALAHDRHPPPG